MMGTFNEAPLISVIMPTYNRGALIEKAIKSVLNQTYGDIEVLVVDDGSTDDTIAVLKGIDDPRIKIIPHDENRGVCAAKNTGMDNINGEWFFIADSDDEMLPHALENLIAVPLYKDSEVNHVVCNIIDYESQQFLGKGFDRDQYWNEEKIYNQTSGEFKALIKTEILGNDRLNERITGWEDLLWTKIRSRSKGYYIHQGLYIVHKEGDDRVCKQMSGFDLEKKAKEYREIKDDDLYWDIVARVDEKRLVKQCIRGMVIPMAVKDKETAAAYASKIAHANVNLPSKIFAKAVMLGGPSLSAVLYSACKKSH